MSHYLESFGRAMQSADRGFTLFGGDQPQIPVLVSVPHAGRDYPEEVFAQLRLPRASLVRLEDRYADLLVRGMIQMSVPVIVAHRARAWIDLNRDERDLDLEMVSGAERKKYLLPGAKQRGGLGLIPRRLTGEGDLWNAQFPIAEVERRIATYHRPYHAQVKLTLEAMRKRFGVAILLDVHSMPPISPLQPIVPRYVVGDQFGQSAAGRYAELLVGRIRQRGIEAALNHPYAGDYILRRHGQLRDNVHALQIEIDRSLYLDSQLREPSAGVAQVSRLLGQLVAALADEALGSVAVAAE